MAPLIVAFLLLWLGGVADYFVQASYFGWRTWGVPVSSTGLHLAWWLDWLPRDGYHIWQAVRNLLWLTGAWYASRLLREYQWWLALIITIGLYVVARGASSSLILQIVR